MSYLGDFRVGTTFDTKFCTVATTGAPTQLAGSPVISAYPDNSLTQITAGITLSVDFDSVTGLNNVRVVATGGNGYATATNYQLVITTGTVGGVSVVGYVVAEFSIEARSALMPTTGGLTLDVSAGGEAGLDWANIGSKTTTNALTNTSIITTQKVDVDTIKTNPVVNGGTITFPTTATLASTTNITAGTITTATTATNLTNAPTSGDFTATMKTSIGTAVAASAVASVTGNVGGNVTGSVGSVVGAVGSVTGNVGGNVTGSVGSVVGAVGSVTGAVGSVTGNVGGNVTGSVGSVVGAVGSVTARVTANSDQFAGQTITAAAGVTMPATVASTTNITAGTITTVTNLTNAPTSGDLTATMKTSVTTAASAATPALSASGNNAAADALLDRADAIETGLTPRQAMRLGSAADAGVLAGAATTSVTIKNAVANSKTRITASVDASGNRSAITTDVT